MYFLEKYKKLKVKIRRLCLYCSENIKHLICFNKIYIGGFSHSKNFGDRLNYDIVRYLSEKKVVRSPFVIFKISSITYYSIGSILQWVKPNSCVWGAGFISENSGLQNMEDINVVAVRGPLSRDKLPLTTNRKIVLGDPALLMPLIFFPKVKKKYMVGVIPHYVDKKNPWLSFIKDDKSVKILDIECGGNWKGFIAELLSCERIFSSSLHGLIIADAYGIPSNWIILSNAIIGDDFKFLDYYKSIGIQSPNKIIIESSKRLSELMSIRPNAICEIDYENLINSCPYITKRRRIELLSKIICVH